MDFLLGHGMSDLPMTFHKARTNEITFGAKSTTRHMTNASSLSVPLFTFQASPRRVILLDTRLANRTAANSVVVIHLRTTISFEGPECVDNFLVHLSIFDSFLTLRYETSSSRASLSNLTSGVAMLYWPLCSVLSSTVGREPEYL